MLPVFRLVVVTVPLLVGCVGTPGESTATSARLVGNRLVASTLAANKVAATKLVGQKLSACQVEPNVYNVNVESSADLLSSISGREVLSAIAACALPSTVRLRATIDDGTAEFTGDLGLAPDWLTAPLSPDGQRWVSACLFSRVNSLDLFIPVSARGPHPALGVDTDERSMYSLQEGGFFGTYFTPKNEPVAWYACRGAGKAKGEDGDLAQRNCAAPDPQNPGLTLCGFNFAGDCGSFSILHACEQFATGGTFYQRCHTASTAKASSAAPMFLQVITTYVLP